MLAGVPEDEREHVWAEIETELRRFEGPTGFVGPCELIVSAADAARNGNPYFTMVCES